MGFSRQEYRSGLPFPSPEDLPDPGIKPGSLEEQADSLPFELQGSLCGLETNKLKNKSAVFIWPSLSLPHTHTHTHTHTVSRGRISTTQHPSQEKNAKCQAGSNHSNCEIQPDGRWKSGCLARDSALPCPTSAAPLPVQGSAAALLWCLVQSTYWEMPS